FYIKSLMRNLGLNYTKNLRGLLRLRRFLFAPPKWCLFLLQNFIVFCFVSTEQRHRFFQCCIFFTELILNLPFLIIISRYDFGSDYVFYLSGIVFKILLLFLIEFLQQHVIFLLNTTKIILFLCIFL